MLYRAEICLCHLSVIRFLQLSSPQGWRQLAAFSHGSDTTSEGSVTAFYHQKPNSAKLDMRCSSQSKLTWTIPNKWFYLIYVAPFFFLAMNYLWTDCDRTNNSADYSRESYMPKRYFKLRPLANYSLAIHFNYSHCNWHFLSVLFKHRLMRLCEYFVVDEFHSFCEYVFTAMHCVWIDSCVSNCETPLLWLLLLRFLVANVNSHMRRVCCQRAKICNPSNWWCPRDTLEADKHCIVNIFHCSWSNPFFFKGQVLRKAELWLCRDCCPEGDVN